MEPLQIYAALFTTVFFNSLITGAIVSYYHEKMLKAVALNRYQRGVITAADLPSMPDMGHYPDSEDPPTYRPGSPRQPLAPDTAAYDEIFKSVRGKC
jgi:hypothetical protein